MTFSCCHAVDKLQVVLGQKKKYEEYWEDVGSVGSWVFESEAWAKISGP